MITKNKIREKMSITKITKKLIPYILGGSLILPLGKAEAKYDIITKEPLTQEMSESTVKDLQQKLNDFYNTHPSKIKYTLTTDGKYGSQTIDAVKSFQQEAGLKADGVAGNETYQKLNELLKSSKKKEVVAANPSESIKFGAKSIDEIIGSTIDYLEKLNQNKNEAQKQLNEFDRKYKTESQKIIEYLNINASKLSAIAKNLQKESVQEKKEDQSAKTTQRGQSGIQINLGADYMTNEKICTYNIGVVFPVSAKLPLIKGLGLEVGYGNKKETSETVINTPVSSRGYSGYGITQKDVSKNFYDAYVVMPTKILDGISKKKLSLDLMVGMACENDNTTENVTEQIKKYGTIIASQNNSYSKNQTNGFFAAGLGVDCKLGKHFKAGADAKYLIRDKEIKERKYGGKIGYEF